jgi:hypothetical protein
MIHGGCYVISRGPAKPDLIEDVLEPELPIVDSYHHLWDDDEALMREEHLLDNLAADLFSGHNIEATVFVEAHARHRLDGPVELRSVGETEFVNAVADEAAKRGIATRVAAGIVVNVDIGLGPAAEEMLDAHQAAAPDVIEEHRGVLALCDNRIPQMPFGLDAWCLGIHHHPSSKGIIPVRHDQHPPLVGGSKLRGVTRWTWVLPASEHW